DLARAAGVALGGETAALLVPRQDGAQLGTEAGQRLVDRHAGAAGGSEDDVHPVVYQALHQDVGPRLRRFPRTHRKRTPRAKKNYRNPQYIRDSGSCSNGSSDESRNPRQSTRALLLQANTANDNVPPDQAVSPGAGARDERPGPGTEFGLWAGQK